MKVDPHGNGEKYERWKAKGRVIKGLCEESRSVILRYLDDMELGRNIGTGSVKGGRSPARLLTLLYRVGFVARHLEERHGYSVLEACEEDLHRLFGDMRSGKIETKNKTRFRSVGDYVKAFKAFWHWHMKVSRKAGRDAVDVCVDLDCSNEKPRWVYLSEEDVRRLCDHAKFKYRVLMMFLFDSGVRSPSELVNIRFEDLSSDCTKLRVREESSKTFGRKINLLLCSKLLRSYVAEKGLGVGDFVFPVKPGVVNRYLKRLSLRVLGGGVSPAGRRYSEVTMYDFRHSSACYWLPRYKSESALKYRFGWKKSSMIHYYTELLGMRDTITREDVLLDEDKTELEARARKAEEEKRILEERLGAIQEQMREILGVVSGLREKVGGEGESQLAH